MSPAAYDNPLYSDPGDGDDYLVSNTTLIIVPSLHIMGKSRRNFLGSKLYKKYL